MLLPVVLIADSSAAVRSRLAASLRRYSCRIIEGPDRKFAWRAVNATAIRLAIVGDIEGGFESSLALCRQIKQLATGAAVYLLRKDSCEDHAIAALRAGASDYFREHDFEGLAAAAGPLLLRSSPAEQAQAALIGSSEVMTGIRSYIDKVAQSDCPVLISGETGTGKELAARALHSSSPRVAKPFVPVNCASIPDSLFESEMFGHEKGAFTGAVGRRNGRLTEADGGTLFLDEVGELSAYAQAKLLRVLETNLVERLGGTGSTMVDLRLVAATNRVLEDMVCEGSFRRDLYFRLTVTRVPLPPLRERLEDIPELVTYYLRDINRRKSSSITGLSREATDALLRYTWPGNVRELKNLVEAIAIEKCSGEVAVRDFPAWFRSRSCGADAVQGERASIVAALERTHWNKSRAAMELHWSRMTLYRKLVRHGMFRPGKKSASPAARSASTGE